MRNRSFFLSNLIYLVVGLTEAVILFRIVFRLFNANGAAVFVHWIYATSSTLLEPFRGVFQSAVVGRGYVLDFTALFALIVYAILGMFLMFLANWLERATATDVRPVKRSA